MKAVWQGLKRYADFRGRTSSREFWEFIGVTHGAVALLCLPSLPALLDWNRFVVDDPEALDAIVGVLMNGPGGGNASWLLRCVWERSREWGADFPGNFPVACGCLAAAVLLSLFLAAPTLAITVRWARGLVAPEEDDRSDRPGGAA